MAKTQAEMQRDYRARQKVTRNGNGNAQNSNGNAPVTEDGNASGIAIRDRHLSDAEKSERVTTALDLIRPVQSKYTNLRMREMEKPIVIPAVMVTRSEAEAMFPHEPGKIEDLPDHARASIEQAKSRAMDAALSVIKTAPPLNADVAMPRKPTFASLPLDVQRSIEQHCSENNNGARAGSHSRAAMTERALSYQAMFGKRYLQGVR